MVFLSHSSVQKALARRLLEALTARGCSSWLDEGQLRAGDTLVLELERAIDAARVFVFLASKDAVRSSTCQYELDRALAREARGELQIVPVRVGEDPASIPAALAGRLWLPVDEESGRGLARVVEAVASRTGACDRVDHVPLLIPVRFGSGGVSHSIPDGPAGSVQFVFVDDEYNRLDERYWALADAPLHTEGHAPDAQASLRRLFDSGHRICRRIISHLSVVARQYTRAHSRTKAGRYVQAASDEMLRRMMHRLIWHMELLHYLAHGTPLGANFQGRKALGDVYDGPARRFAVGPMELGKAQVPKGRHPYGPDGEGVPWELSSPISDLSAHELGRVIGQILAEQLMAGTRDSPEIPAYDTLLYGLG